MLPIHAGCPATTPGQSGIDEDDDDPTSGLLPQGFHTVPVHHQAVAGFHPPRPPAEQIGERLNLNKLVAPLGECYCPDLEHEKALRSMKLFADEVIPHLKQKAFPALQ